jgi:hypothetical protein
MAKPIRHATHIPRVTLYDDNTAVPRTAVNVPVPSGLGRGLTNARANVASLDPTVPNPVYDLDANRQVGVTFHIGAIPYGQQ